MNFLYCRKIIVMIPFISTIAYADDVCTQKSHTEEVDSCYLNEKVEYEMVLSQEYKELKDRILKNYSADKIMQKKYSDKLLSVQRNWLKYRDEQCSMEALFADHNTAANLTLINKCISRIDLQRISEMKSLPY